MKDYLFIALQHKYRMSVGFLILQPALRQRCYLLYISLLRAPQCLVEGLIGQGM